MGLLPLHYLSQWRMYRNRITEKEETMVSEPLIKLCNHLELIEREAYAVTRTIQRVHHKIVRLNMIIDFLEDGGGPSGKREEFHGILSELNEDLVSLGIDPDPVWHCFNASVELTLDALGAKEGK